MDRFSKRLQGIPVCLIILLTVSFSTVRGQLVISEISPNAEVEALEQYGGGEWFEICNIGQTDMDISGYTIGHYEDASFGQSDFYLGADNDNCDCGGSYGVITFTGSSQSNDVILSAGKCLLITGQTVDCGNAEHCINARDLLKNGPSGIVSEYHSSRNDFPGTGTGTGRGGLEGHFWRQKNYECNAYYIWNANDEIIDAVNFNCLPQTGPDAEANVMSGGFHYPDGNGGYYDYPPHFPTPPANGPFPVGIEITNTAYTWVGQSIEEGFTFQRCSTDPTYVFPPQKFDPVTGQPTESYNAPTCGEINDDCCSDCDNNRYFQGIQLPNCTNGSAIGLVIEENENMAEMEVLTSAEPSCNNSESRLRSNYDDNEISFCTLVKTPADFNRPFVGFVNSLDEEFSGDDCAIFTGASVYQTNDCSIPSIASSLSSKNRQIFELEVDEEYTLCFNYDISNCQLKNRIYWDNPCFSPFYCQLDVDCPVVIRDTVDCLVDVPIAVTDTTAFELELGGEILSSCDDVILSHTDSIGLPEGSNHKRTLYREYLLTDGMDTTYCTLEYPIINRINPTLVLTADTIYLDQDGMLALSPEMFIERAYDTCEDTIKSASITPDMIDGNDLGEIDIIVEVIDSAGNSTDMMIEVIVGDITPPTVTCPNDTIINVPACVCESVYVFTDPPAIDELGGPVIIVRIDTTGLMAGDLFPAGLTTIIYSATDESGNETICSYDVTVISGDPGPIILKSQLNFSLSEICDGYPTAAMFLEDTLLCGPESYYVSIFDENGVRIDEDSLRNYRNIILTARVEYTCFENFNETNILIEDKFRPVIACSSDTITCDEFLTFGIPEVMDNCDDQPQLILLNEVPLNVACSDPNLSRIITRTYTAIDDDGQRSDTCVQVLSISKFDLSTVEFNGIDTLIYCGDLDPNQIDGNGNPSPSLTGFPTAGGVSLWPDQNTACGVTSSYIDIDIPGSTCGYSILRQWNVMFWDCFQDGMRQFFQTIEITDNQGPTFTCPNDFTIETDAFTCQAVLNMNLPMGQDECNNGVFFQVDYPDAVDLMATSISQSLEKGTHEITLTASDLCGQTTTCSFNVTVIDNEDPIAIVQGNYSVSLSGSEVIVTADELNNASFDECVFVEFEIARMEAPCDTSDLTMSEDIHICCEDIGTTVMVMFQVTDGSGNTSIAMIAIEVEDNAGPVLIEGLPDITVSCEYPYVLGQTMAFGSIANSAEARDTIIIEADSVIFSAPAVDALVSDNCDMTVTVEIISENLDLSCGLGTITRMLTATDNSNNSISFLQNITFSNFFPFTTEDVDWPANLTLLNICDPANLEPAFLDEPNNRPILNTDNCDNVSDAKIDDIDYGPFQSDTLFVINRQWTAADWCQTENGQFLRVDSTQTITVLNTVEPSFTGGCSAIVECNNSPTCEDINIPISISAMDDCTSATELIYSYSIDFNTDNTADITGNSNSAMIDFPIGNHLITWIVLDAQGNQDLCFQEVTIENCNLPSPICLSGQIFSLIAVDTDGDMDLDDEQVTINVNQIDGGSSVACGVPFTLSFSTDVSKTDTLFNCDDLGTHFLRLYVTDNVTGAQDFCEVPVEIIDDNMDDICSPPTPPLVTISGMITSEMDKATNLVMLELEGTDMQSMSEDGAYTFDAMPQGGSYMLKPSLETYPLDGITTYDILLIQKHILGLKILDSPYKMLAADTDGSENISGADILNLRKLILGDIASFENQKEWQFVWKDHTFIDYYNPWLDVTEMYEIPSLTSNMDIDFISIKTGDINNSSPNLSNNQAEIRSVTTMDYELLEYNNEIIVPVRFGDLSKLEGFQFSFRYNAKDYTFKDVMSGTIQLNENMISTKDQDLGVIDLSWISPSGQACENCIAENKNNSNVKLGQIAQKEVSFYIIMEPISQANNDGLQLNLEVFSEGLKTEAYLADGSITGLDFVQLREQEEAILLYQNKPNPWKNNTMISFFIPEDLNASVVISDVTGREVFRKSGLFGAGMNEIEVAAESLGTAGIYYYSLQTETLKYTKKMILIE